MLGHGFWMRRFNGDSSIVGAPFGCPGGRSGSWACFRRTCSMSAARIARTVTGSRSTSGRCCVVPREEHPAVALLSLLQRGRPGTRRGQSGPDGPGSPRDRQSVASRYPAPNSPWKPRAVPLKEEIVGSAASTLVVIAGAAAAVLLLACVNVASLLLGRAVGRSREIAVRAALGATRGRLARQLLVESLVLAGAGGMAGAALAYAAVAALARFGPADLPRLQMITVDGRVLLFTAAATLGSAVLFGLAPALRLARTGVGGVLKDGGGPRRLGASAPARSPAAEVALAFLLVVSSGLLLRSFVSMLWPIPGFEPAARSRHRSTCRPRAIRPPRRPILRSGGGARPRAAWRARRGLQLRSAVDGIRRKHVVRHHRTAVPRTPARKRDTTSSRRDTPARRARASPGVTSPRPT